MFKYLFMQLGTTKSWSDSKAAIDRLADIRHVDERGAEAACMVAGDEETFRFMYHLIRSNPNQYHWLRIYVGDWHLLYHMVKALNNQYWGAGIEFIAEALGLDGTKASEAGNYRVAHHTISVFYEAMWSKIVAMYYSEHGPDVEVINRGAAAKDAAGAPGAVTAPASDPTEASATAPGTAITPPTHIIRCPRESAAYGIRLGIASVDGG